MSTVDRGDTPSILDGRLIRLLDDEVSTDERRELEALIAGSPDVRERYDHLRSLSAHVSAGLAGESFPAAPKIELPERVARRRARSTGLFPPWRAAAAVALLVAVGVSVEPVRAFLTTGAARLLDLLAPQDPVPVEVEPTPVVSDPSTVRFAPGGAVFTVTVEAKQAMGELRITASEDAVEVTAAVVDGGRESLVVLPSELRVSNDPTSTTDYRVEVPRSLGRVDVRIGGTVAATIRPADLPGVWTFSLANGAGR